MPIELKMPALSPTMEEGTLAKWLVKEGDEVKSGDILAEIETDKATMEFEAVDEGRIAKILVAEGTDGVKVGAPIAILAGEGGERRNERCQKPPLPQREAKSRSAPKDEGAKGPEKRQPQPSAGAPATPPHPASRGRSPRPRGERARPDQGLPARPPPGRSQGIDLKPSQGSGPGGRIVRADLGEAAGGAAAASSAAASQPLAAPVEPRATSRTRSSSFRTCARRSRGG